MSHTAPPPGGSEPLDASERELATALRNLPAGTPSAALDARILAAARQAVAPQPRARTVRGWRAVGLGTAASALIATGLFLRMHRDGDGLLHLPAATAVPEAARPAAGAQADRAGSADAAAMPPPLPSMPSPSPPPEMQLPPPPRTPAPAPAPAMVPPTEPAMALEAPAATVPAKPGGAAERIDDAHAQEAAPIAFPRAEPARQERSAAAPAAPAAAPPSPVAADVTAPARDDDRLEDRRRAKAAPPPALAQPAAKAVGAAVGTTAPASTAGYGGRKDDTGARSGVKSAAAAENAPAPANAGDEAALAPSVWLDRIRQRLAAGDRDGARASLRRFQQDHPDLPIPDDLRVLLP